jgi:hypothetical protein
MLQVLTTRLSLALLEMQRDIHIATGSEVDVSEGPPEELAGGAEAAADDAAAPVAAPEGGKSKRLFKSLKRAVSTHSALSGVARRAQEKSMARQAEEILRAADARAALEFARRMQQEKVAEEHAATTLQGAQRGKTARGPQGHIPRLRKERAAQATAERRAAQRALAKEEMEEAHRHKAASKMQASQRGILARERTAALREERTTFRKRMLRLRIALRSRAAAMKIALQIAAEAAARRARLAEEASEEYSMTDARLDLLEAADTTEGSPRAAAWAAFRGVVEASAMMPIALGSVDRPPKPLPPLGDGFESWMTDKKLAVRPWRPGTVATAFASPALLTNYGEPRGLPAWHTSGIRTTPAPMQFVPPPPPPRFGPAPPARPPSAPPKSLLKPTPPPSDLMPVRSPRAASESARPASAAIRSAPPTIRSSTAKRKSAAARVSTVKPTYNVRVSMSSGQYRSEKNLILPAGATKRDSLAKAAQLLEGTAMLPFDVRKGALGR